MRLALKIFLANSLVILVLAGVAAWSLISITRLSIADRSVTVQAAETLRLEVSLREAVMKASRLELRNLVFGDREYAEVSSREAARIAQELQQLGELVTTDEERARLGEATQRFSDYRAAVRRARELRERGDTRGAEQLLQTEAVPLADRVVSDLDRLVGLAQTALDQMIEAAGELRQARSEVERLRIGMFTAVPSAMVVAILAALAGTAFIAIRMTRSLRRLSQATTALAEGKFREPLAVTSADEIGQLARSFNSMAARLREVDAMKEQFYATISHELRSPLTALRESAHILETKMVGPLTEKQEHLLAIMQKSTDRLLRLVTEVLDLSRADAGLLPLERRSLDLNQVATRAVDELRSQAEQRGIMLRLESTGTPRLYGDEDRIVQIIVNLVANALRFTPSGGTVTVRLIGSDKEVEVQVQDTGIGIRADLLPAVFDRFRQAHSGRGGTGLGLAIVRSLVDAHGGRVTVASEEGKGSTFTVTLPREAAAAPDRRGEQGNS